MAGADIFLGLSAGRRAEAGDGGDDAAQPIIFALANPTPEILPEEVHRVRDDAIVATGRTDYPNQINNVLCFPYIFRGALDSGATTITVEMEIAAVHAIAELAQAEQSEVVAAAYAGAALELRARVPDPEAVRPAADDADRAGGGHRRRRLGRGLPARSPTWTPTAQKLQTFVYASGTTMRPIFSLAKARAHKRIAYAEGEEERVLRAVQVVVDESLARPTLIGRPEVIAQRIAKFGLRLVADRDYDLVNTENDHRFRDYWQTYHAADRAQGRHRAAGQDRDAAPPDADRLDAAAQGRGRRHALRHLGLDGHAPALHRPGDRPARRRQDLRLHERADPARAAR